MDQDTLLTLALELAAEGVTGRTAVRALAGAGRGRLDAVAAARRDCQMLADGGYPHAARALTLLAMTVHPSAAAWWSDGDGTALGEDAQAVSPEPRGTCRSAALGRPRRT
jgi:hypothetical protein